MSARDMPRNDEWDEDDWDDEDYPEEPEESGIVECLSCGADVYEDAESCPICGEYIVSGERAGTSWQGKPNWFVILGVMGITAAIAAMLFR